jgi:hypothetical protein
MIIIYFFLYLWVIFALLDPDPDSNADPDSATQINVDPCDGSGSGSTTLLLIQHDGIFAILTYLGHADAARIHFGITIVVLRTCGLNKGQLIH